MEKSSNYFDLLTERRKSSDILWASRYMDIIVPHYLSSEHNWSRNQAIEFTLKHPKVLNVIESLAETQNVDKSFIVREARNILEEVASRHHLPTFRWLAIVVVKVLKRILQSFRVNVKYLLDIKGQMMYSDVQYVYVPSHRSYLDFILMSYLLFNYDMAIPNIASGMDFYRMNIVGEILRKTGAFYMRRSFSTDLLYKETFKAYVASLVEHSDRAIEFFIEGTRSRSQKSIAPKFGLLGMILESLFQGRIPDILFIPVSISYDKPLEESLFSYELLGVPKPAETTTGLFKSLSILREQQAHGHVYFHINPPISAAKFMDVSSRKISALYPNSKVPAEIVKNIAYAIIDSQKEHTVFMPINLIAVLVNERIHSHPGNPYSFDGLLQDYCWLKKLITQSLGSSVYPSPENLEEDNIRRSEKDEIKESLNTHRNLLGFDSNGMLIIHGSQREIKSNKTIRVKGHTLDDRTMSIAVPTINLAIYVNPIFAIFTKLSIAVLSINSDNLSQEIAEEQYVLLRSLLTTEFALPDNNDREVIIDEFRKELSFLINEKCYKIYNNQLTFDCNNTLRMLLNNLLLPFISAIYVTCIVLLQWDKTMGELSDQEIMKECQKRTEILLFQGESFINHPYTLSLDLYTSTLVSLSSYGAITSIDSKPRVYNPDKNKLSFIISELEKIVSQRPPGNYVDLAQSFFHFDNTLQAKL
ncbi:dihydroxyacetone phosphate acyltransferase [Microplitis demolitor]|uniref:dihydroxyacetone phosphate acyltransferase n=1 Tax=Microplitis demolitor TaxID=69319 RepID=UPI000440019C|nr:dihydroxyacetone phosphate acyltransferase [Microplitis demolitor]